MLRLGLLELNGTPRVAIGFSEAPDKNFILEAKNAGVDIAEVRIDQFTSFDPKYVKEKLALFRGIIPTIATIRIKAEGGRWDKTEEQRQQLFESIIPDVDAIDIELRSNDTLEKISPALKAHGKLLVISHHDYATTPEYADLEDVVERAKSHHADITKIATYINEQDHVRTLARLLIAHAQDNMIVIGMGSKGVVTRALFPALGSVITFSFANGPRTAPGQLPYTRMNEILRTLYPSYNESKIIDLQLLEAV